MLHPSYTDLMNAVNSDVEEGGKPIVNSRYSIVIATARRARQLIAHPEAIPERDRNRKPLSIAVDEIMSGDVKILSGGADFDGEEDKLLASDVYVDVDVDDEDYAEDEDAVDTDEDADDFSDDDENEDADEEDTEDADDDGDNEDDYE